MTFGERLRAARQRLKPKVTLAKVAEACGGVTPQAVSQWEKDIDTPGQAKLRALRRVLKVTYFWLMEGEGPPPAPDSLEVTMEDLSDAERQAVEAFVETLQKRRGHAA